MSIPGSIGREGRRRVCESHVKSRTSTNHDSSRSPSAQLDLPESVTIFDDRVRRLHELRAAGNQ
mgnify:CR=1 FL=1